MDALTVISLYEASKQALEALEHIQYEDNDRDFLFPYQCDKLDDAITTLRVAIASYSTAIHEWEQAAVPSAERGEAHKKQEPVGCEGAIVNGRVYADRLEHDYQFECEAGPLRLCNDWVEFRRCFEWLAIHATPPAAQRQWVSLTDEEVQWIYDNGRTPAGMIDMAEAKLKEKNDY